MTVLMSLQSIISLNCCLCSNDESSPSQAMEVSVSEGLKSDKFYVTSALPDGVLQQVEVNAGNQLSWHMKICVNSWNSPLRICFLFSVSCAVMLQPLPPVLVLPVWAPKCFHAGYAWCLSTDALIWRTTRGRTWMPTPSSVLIVTLPPPPGLRLKWVSQNCTSPASVFHRMYFYLIQRHLYSFERSKEYPN